MATPAQVRGMLLEEVLLFLLETSGYRTVELEDIDGRDELLRRGAAGIELWGRGAKHQIDAIADYMIAHPFSHPQRLLVEAKCYKPNRRVGIDVIRNSVGVLKDVSEHWVTAGPNATTYEKRFHYQSAVFSATGYTVDAERFAFAHDIYLIPLTSSRFISSVIGLIHRIKSTIFGVRRKNVPIDLKPLRQAFRNAIRRRGAQYGPSLEGVVSARNALELLWQIVGETQKIRGAALAMINDRFPVFLIPNRHVDLSKLDDLLHVQIRRQQGGWFIEAAREEWWMREQRQLVDNPRRLFSFDLPAELFEEYARHDLLTGRPRLSRQDAVQLNEDAFSEIQATIVTENQQFRVLTLRLDPDWLYGVQERLKADERSRGQEY